MRGDPGQAGRSRSVKKKATPSFTKKRQENYLDELRNGVRRGAAAEIVGLPRDLVLAFIADHEDFEGRVIDAEKEALEHVEEALYQAAISGNVNACKMWLDYQKGLGGLPEKGGWDAGAALAELNAMAAD